MTAAQHDELLRVSWPVAQLAEGVEALARANGWRDVAAVEQEPVAIPYGSIDEFFDSAAPAVIRFATPEGERALLLVRSRRDALVVLDPAHARRSISRQVVRAALTAPLEAPRLAEIERVLDAADVPRGRRESARDAVLREQLASERIEGAFLLRLPMSAPRAALLREARLKPRLAGLLALHALEYVLWMGAWWLVGKGALDGHFERGWLLAFGLLIVTLIPLAMQRTAMVGRLAIEAGTLLKRRLLAGALALDSEQVKREGVGQALSRVLESEAVETLAVGSGLLALLALVEFALALLLLLVGANWLLALGLLLFIVATLWAARGLGRRRASWTQARLELTHEVVEKMVGHRTRLAQEPAAQRHDEEDRGLERYADVSAQFDRAARWLAVLPRGWLVVGLCGLAPQFVGAGGGGGSAGQLAVTLGAIVVAWRAFAEFTAGISDLLGAGIGWKLVAPLFAAAEAAPQQEGAPRAGNEAAREDGAEPVVSAHDVHYRYRERGEPVLRGVNLSVARGDRILLEGPSGSGKSTLCSLLAGLREPESGLLLLRGLDLATLHQQAWRRRVAAAPQFHENHVFSNTLAFNLLLGRAWPPAAADLELAERLCDELGLKPLLARMPSGLQQMVGETGWQLSHGEQSRVYIARALLQEAELVLLDESFAALDPKTLRDVLACVERRAPSLLVVAHP